MNVIFNSNWGGGLKLQEERNYLKPDPQKSNNIEHKSQHRASCSITNQNALKSSHGCKLPLQEMQSYLKPNGYTNYPDYSLS